MIGKTKEQVALYGLGNAGKSIYPYINKLYDISFWVDANEKIWGTEYHGIPICQPQHFYSYQGKVIVTTTDSYFMEIAQKLMKMGIKKENIFRGQHQIYDQKEEIVPFDISFLKQQNICLKEADLLNNTEKIGSHKVMILCAFYSVYAVQLIRNLKKRYPIIEFSLLCNSEKYKSEIEGYASHIYVYHSYGELYGILDMLPVYNAFQMLWIENIWVFFRNIIRRKCKKLNLCVGGSDFYRARVVELGYKEQLIKMADVISAETDQTISDFISRYGQSRDKIRWVNFGIEALDYIDENLGNNLGELRQEFGISGTKLIVTCGHNANDSHQHLRMVSELTKMKPVNRDSVILVFPMTYPEGQNDYIRKVQAELDKAGFDYRILTGFMDTTKMAKYACISDIMVHVQTTDQLSSTMLEEMYAGSVVVVGNWLPYGMLRNKGIEFWSVDYMGELADILDNIVENFDTYRSKCKKNRKKIHELSSWDETGERWINLWNMHSNMNEREI
ncbi:MAG: glycosyltransferase family 4 protein [Lachnospiraceae bacterium]|nr:glycosyltransferase family 4 protein [Lachnospiraceae bacterium]